ncbi:MAG: DUF4418 family protein [Coriobacteriales bacterium]|nr:DUF4418 family protein [Coriobacteriales bacterium]
MQQNKAQPVAGIILAVLSVLLLVGVGGFAGPCGAHNGAMPATCQWAARAVLGVGVVSAVLSLVRIFERDEGERRGLSLSVALLGVLVAVLPGVLIDLCADPAMRCVVLMRPFCVAVGVAIALVGGTDLTLRLIRVFGK